MHILTRIEPAGSVTLLVRGTIDGASVADVDQAFVAARRLEKPVCLDLAEVALIDRPSLQYLIDLIRSGVRIVNCPDYIARWIERERREEDRA